MSLVIATICEEGIVIAADTKLMVLLNRNNPETGEEVEVTSWFTTTGSKMVLTDNNVGIAFVGRLMVKGMMADLFFSQYFAQRPGLNARQVAEEINRFLVQEPEMDRMEVLVAGMMDARCKMADGSTMHYKRPWLFDLSTAKPGKILDAIDFSTIWLEMSYRLMRFQDRERSVGPPIEVMVIDKDGGSFESGLVV